MLLNVSEIRSLRQERGWDVPEMARQLRLAAGNSAIPSHEAMVRMIRRWEAGTNGMSERYQFLFKRALGLSATTHDHGEGDSQVQRREFLTASAVLAGSLATAPQFAYLAAGRRISADVPRQLAVRLARLRRLDNYLGGSETYHLYASELEATRTLAREATCAEPVRQALLAVISEQAQQAGWAAFDTGWQATARAHYQDSLSAARDAGDRALQGNALALLAYQNLTTGDPAASLAQASCDAIGTAAPPRARALLHERRAWVLATSRSGQPSDVERALGSAADILCRDDGASGPDWAAWADESELQIITGRCLTSLGQPRRAIPMLRAALASFDDAQARDKALYLSWLADAYLDAGDTDEAAAITSQALTLAAGVGSVRPAQRLREIIQRLGRHPGAPQAADLREQAAHLNPPTWHG